MKKSVLAVAFAAIGMFGCDDGFRAVQQNASEQMIDKVADENVNFENIAQRYFDAQLALNPIAAVYMGDFRFNDKFVNSLTDEFLAQQHQTNTQYLKWVNDIDREKLNPARQISYDILKRDLQRSLQAESFPDRFIPFTQFYSLLSEMAQLGSGQSAQPFNTVKDYEDFAKRLSSFVQWIESAQVRLAQGIDNKIVLPRVLVTRILPQISAHIVSDPRKSIYYTPLNTLPEQISTEDGERLRKLYRTIISEKVAPAYQSLYEFIAQEYMPASRTSAGYGALPNGASWYQFIANGHTTTQMPVEEIHQLGRKEVARILKEMDSVRVKVGFEGDLKAFFKHLSDDPSFHFKTKQQVIDGYTAYKDTIDKVLPQYFDVIPKAPYIVKAVEAFREKSAAGASYVTGSPDGTRPGTFYVNTYDLTAQPTWGVTTLSLHEAAPGHHFQLSLQQELEDLPEFQRFGGQTAFIEGWALYAEELGIEMGLFEDPYQLFGKLGDEMLRAMRLVVDTGLHAKGWSREQAIEYMLDNSSMAKSAVVAEVERYMALPGQALSYKIGQMKILDLRDKAKQQLGEKFDIKAFHNQVLLDGALPMAVLESKIDTWIASQVSN